LVFCFIKNVIGKTIFIFICFSDDPEADKEWLSEEEEVSDEEEIYTDWQ
jgi:hypothetical protein